MLPPARRLQRSLDAARANSETDPSAGSVEDDEMRSAGRRRPVGAALSITLALVGSLALAPIVSSHALTNAWQAKIGSAGVNGTAKVQVFDTGIGTLTLKLAKLKASTSVPVVLHKGTCSSVGAVLLKLASIKTSSSGAAARTSNLSTSQVTLIKAATKGTARIAIRVASSTTGGVKCGLFAVLAVPPPLTPTVAATITVGGSPSGVTVDPSGVWVTNWFDNTLSRIDPATNTVLNVVPLDITGNAGPERIAGGAGSIWVTISAFDDAGENELPGSVKRIDPVSGKTLATIPVGKGPFDIGVTAGAVWVPNQGDGTLTRIDPATNQVVATIPVSYATAVAVGLGAVWVVSYDGRVTRIDPATNQVVATIYTQTTGAQVVTGGGAVWVTNFGDPKGTDGSVSRIDPATNTVVANIPLGADPEAIAFAGGSVWVGLAGEPTVVRVSATTNAVLNRITVSAKVWEIAATDHAVWAVHNLPLAGASTPPNGSVTRINF